MKNINADLWQPARQWRIVTADADLAHVFPPPSTFSFDPTQDGNGFNIRNMYGTPSPDCFSQTVLIRAGTSEPTFEQMTGETELPDWADDPVTRKQYTDAADLMSAHFQKDPDVKRLQGFIRIPCHAHGAKLEPQYLQNHSPMWIQTQINVYQFSGVVNGDGPLLVIWTPISRVCPLNGNGTIIGLS